MRKKDEVSKNLFTRMRSTGAARQALWVGEGA